MVIFFQITLVFKIDDIKQVQIKLRFGLTNSINRYLRLKNPPSQHEFLAVFTRQIQNVCIITIFSKILQTMNLTFVQMI